MNSLRLRLTVAFIFVALLPMGVLGWLAQQSIEERTRDAYSRQLATRVESARARLTDQATRTVETVGRLCAHDTAIDQTVLDLARGEFGPSSEARLEGVLPPMMRSVGFDVLGLVVAGGRDRGRVLGAAHYPARAGGRNEPLLQALRLAGDRPFVAEVRLRDGPAPARDTRAWLAGCIIDRDGVRVAVVGGTRLEQDRMIGLVGDDTAVRFALIAPGEALPDDIAHGGGRDKAFVFNAPHGAPVLEVVAAIDDADLAAQLRDLQERNLLVAGLAVLVALLLAAFLALRLSRPLRELEDAAARIGAGDLELTVGHPGGGEVGRTFTAFNRMTRELKVARRRLRRAERIAAWRDIARRIAHEIKNPLSPIQVSIETMRKTHAKQHPDFEEIFEESTVTILEEVARMKRIVTEFSEFARMPRPQPADLRIQAVAAHVASLHSGEDFTLEIQDEGAVPEIRADREQLTQVLMNLIQNARDAAVARQGEARAVVRVTVRAEGEGVAVDVLDNGPGIPLSQRDGVFEPYFTTKASGTGLGLAVVQRIVEDHGGRIEVGDGIDGGAAMRLWLPVSGPVADAAASHGATMSELRTAGDLNAATLAELDRD